MPRFLLFIGIVMCLCLLSYRLGFKQAQLETTRYEVKKEQKMLQHKSNIYSRPNASRSELLSLFNAELM